jgi:hypothetical protein
MFFPPLGFGRISLRLKRESRNYRRFWMPVFTGMTFNGRTMAFGS